MNEMVEKVARTLCRLQGYGYDALQDGPTQVAGGSFIYGRDDYRRQARAALEALLDPTRSMIEAGKFWSTAPDDFEQDSVFGNLDGVDSYRSMITEALK